MGFLDLNFLCLIITLCEVRLMVFVVEYVQSLWPFSAFVFSDLKASDRIVRKLRVPETTKNFVCSIPEPESQAVIYVLSVQNLSERSALDAACLIKEIKPDAVVVQVGHSNGLGGNGFPNGGTDSMKKSSSIGENGVIIDECSVPTSSLEVLRRCFVHKSNKEKYEDMAGSVVSREIFGVSFNQHFVTAKKAADEVGSSFFILESPFVRCSVGGVGEWDLDTENEVAKS